jgi:hypothetical protein
MKQAKQFIGYAMVSAIGGIGISFVLVNFLIGCGEPIYHPDGSWKTGECVGITYQSVRSQ